MANVESGETRYVPKVPTNTLTDDADTREIVRWAKTEFDNISRAMSSLEYQFPALSAPPIRYFVGSVAYADGVNWNPGSGEGLYVYKSTGWALLG